MKPRAGCQGARWQRLLTPFAPISVLRCTQAIYAGLFINRILPLGLGELARASLIVRWVGVKLSTVITSIGVEVLLDGVWLTAGIIVTMKYLSLPRDLVEAGYAISIAVLTACSLLVLIALKGQRVCPCPVSFGSNGKNRNQSVTECPEQKLSSRGGNWRRLIARVLGRLSIELRAMALSRNSLVAFLLSLAMLILQGMSFWLVMRAYGLSLPLLAGVAVILIVHLGSAVPTVPGNIGTYQFFTVVGLKLFGVDKAAASGFSMVVYAVLSLPVFVFGFWSLGRSGLTLFDIKPGCEKRFAQKSKRNKIRTVQKHEHQTEPQRYYMNKVSLMSVVC